MKRRSPSLAAILALAAACWAPGTARAQAPSADSAAARARAALADSSASQAQAAPRDSLLDRFLGDLADSTDHYFGMIAAPLDTAGLDSALADGLARPSHRASTRTRPTYAPAFAFNRVDGNVWGGALGLVNQGAGWSVRGDFERAAGSDRWLGGGRIVLRLRGSERDWRFQVDAGRRTESMDRDHEERQIATLRALVAGSDRQNYLRRDGTSVAARVSGSGWDAAIAYHDRREAPLAVTTRWNLAHRALGSPTNLAAVLGRNQRTREVAFDASLRWPWIPFSMQGTLDVSDGAIGSDFDYRRVRLATGGDLPVGRHLSLLPQLVYGRLSGDAVPQASFFLGGARTLRSLPGAARGGAGLALARLDIIGADDVLSLVHIPHPALLTIQVGVFGATGAVWGDDPYLRPAAPGNDDAGGGDVRGWPERNAWLSELGFSFLYRPGVPDDQAYLRINFGRAVGPGSGEGRWSIDYSRALDLLRRE